MNRNTPFHVFSALKHFTKRFMRNSSGVVTIITGLAIFTLIGATGFGVADMAAQSLVQTKIQQSSDLSALAAGVARLNGSDENTQAQVAQRYFDLNFPPVYNSAQRPTPNITINSNGIEVNAETEVPGGFAQSLGLTPLNVSARTVIGSVSQTTIFGREVIICLLYTSPSPRDS